MEISKSMTKGNPSALLIRFAYPILLSNILQLLYSIVDSAVVGNMIGVNAFAAVGAAGTLNWMVFSIILGLSQGFGTVIARYFGAGDREKLKSGFAMSLFLTLSLGISISVLTLLGAGPLLKILRTPDEIIADATIYLQIMYGGMFITFLYNCFGSVLRGVGNSKIPFYALIFSSVLNIVLDILLVSITSLGVAAVALATIISQLASCVFCYSFIKRIDVLKLSGNDFKIDRGVIASLVKLGGPIGFQNLVVSLGSTIAQYIINGYGTDFIAGIHVTKRLYSLIEIVGSAMEGAVATYVAQNYGARLMSRIRFGVKAAARILLIGAGIMMILLFIFGRGLMGLLIAGDDLQVKTVLDIAYEQLIVILCLLPFLHLLYLFRSSLQGMNNSFIPMLSGFTEMACRLLSILILPPLIGRWGLYLTESLGWPVAAVLLFVAFLVDYRKHCRILGKPAEDKF